MVRKKKLNKNYLCITIYYISCCFILGQTHDYAQRQCDWRDTEIPWSMRRYSTDTVCPSYLSLSLSFHFISIWTQCIISGGTASGTESDPSGSKHRHLWSSPPQINVYETLGVKQNQLLMQRSIPTISETASHVYTRGLSIRTDRPPPPCGGRGWKDKN